MGQTVRSAIEFGVRELLVSEDERDRVRSARDPPFKNLGDAVVWERGSSVGPIEQSSTLRAGQHRVLSDRRIRSVANILQERFVLLGKTLDRFAGEVFFVEIKLGGEIVINGAAR
jgi:hypothetical protein